MTDFQTRLLRLLTVGLTLIGSLGLAAIAYRFRLPYAIAGFIVALLCTIYLLATLIVGVVRWQIAVLTSSELPWDLPAPKRSPLDSSQPT